MPKISRKKMIFQRALKLKRRVKVDTQHGRIHVRRKNMF